MIFWIGHHKEIRKLTFRELALRRRLHWTPIFRSKQRPQTWTLPSLHWRLCRCYFFYQRGTQSILTAVNSFYRALKYTWDISDTPLAFRDIKVSIEGNGSCTSVQYKPADSHSYLLYSSSHLYISHVKNSIRYSQFLWLRRLCSEDPDFSLKSEEMCDFFHKRGYPTSFVQAGHHRAQQIDRQLLLQTSQKENNDRIPFTLTTTH